MSLGDGITREEIRSDILGGCSFFFTKEKKDIRWGWLRFGAGCGCCEMLLFEGWKWVMVGEGTRNNGKAMSSKT